MSDSKARHNDLPFERKHAMRKSLGKWVRSVATRSLQAMTVMCLFVAVFCHAQAGSASGVTACFPTNNNLPDTGLGASLASLLYPDGPPIYDPFINQYELLMARTGTGGGLSSPGPFDSWAPNHTYTVSIEGNYPVGTNTDVGASDGCPNVFLSARTWDGVCGGVCGGALDPYVSLSDLAFGGPALNTLTATVGNAPDGYHFLVELDSLTGFIWIWRFTIRPQPPPNPPSPPNNGNCPTIYLAPVSPGAPATASIPAIPSTPISPNVWMAGVSTPIVIKGSGFTSQQVGNCIATQITVTEGNNPESSVPVPISGIKIVDDDTITAVVTPPASPSTPQPAAEALGKSAITPDATPSANSPTVLASVMLTGTAPPENANSVSASIPIINPKLYIIDPYLPPFNGTTSIDPQTVISNISSDSAYSAVQAKGMITDGSATAIAVYSVGVNKQVTFTGTDGLQFESWNPSFLSYPPSYGNCSGPCSIKVNPIQGNDGSYYAFALMQAPKQSSSVIYTPQAASVTASITINNQKNTSPPVQLGVGPTPVVFVHGLWADATTFDNMSFSLNQSQPWGEGALLYTALSAISYTKVFPFDADAAPNSAKSELSEDITTVLSTVDGAKYVGGRVDLVAHSMGGLVARHYSSRPLSYLFKTTRSRNQGQFRTVVTIDTPENGSALAPFLLQPNVAGGTCSTLLLCRPTATDSSPTTIWKVTCTRTLGDNVTLAACLNNLDKPLGPRGDGPGGFNNHLCLTAGSTNCGAVASLAPNSPNIHDLPSANIPNSQWFAIGSDWIDNGTSSKPSELRSFFDNLLEAMDLTPAQTLSSVLGDINNDVIVTANSQFWNSSGGQVAEFPYLAHATMPSYFGLGALISETSNDSVLTSDAVTNCVETILLNSSTSACTGAQTGGPASSSTGIAAASVFDESQATQQGSEKTSLEENPEERVQRLEHPFTLAPGRISVQAPQVHVPLGNPIDINVTLAPGKLVNGTLSISQHSKSGDQSQGSGPAKVVRQEGSTMTIEITPVQIGSVDVEIGAIYSDNAFVSQTIHLDVVPAATGVRNFSLNQGAHFMTLVLEDAEADRQKTLIPVVSYEGVKYPIYLDDSSGIKFSLKQDEVNPVIQIDEHGRVHALREGTAVLEGDFDGLRDVVQVTVYGKDDAPEGYRTVLH